MVLSVVTLVPLASRDEGDSRVAPGGGRGGEERPPGLTRTGSTSRPSGRAERFILAMCCSVASAACVFPVETLNRADSGMNWARTTKNMGIASGADLGGAAVIVPHVPPSRLPQTGTDVAREEARRSPAFRGGSERTRPRGPCRRPSPRDGGADSALHASLARATC